MQLTVMPNGPSSWAICRVNPIWPALALAYAWIPVRLTVRPGSRGDVDDPAPAALLHRPAPPPGCTGRCWSGWRRRPHASRSSVTSSSGWPTCPTTPPALLTRMSTPPSPAKNSRTVVGAGQVRLVLVDPVHGGSVAAQRLGDRGADAVRRAGHHRGLPGQPGRHLTQPSSSSARTSATPACPDGLHVLVRARVGAAQHAVRCRGPDLPGSSSPTSSRGMTGFGSAGSLAPATRVHGKFSTQPPCS